MNEKVNLILKYAFVYYKIAYDFFEKHKLIISSIGLVVVTVVFFYISK